jgi:hypothetical protein
MSKAAPTTCLSKIVFTTFMAKSALANRYAADGEGDDAVTGPEEDVNVTVRGTMGAMGAAWTPHRAPRSGAGVPTAPTVTFMAIMIGRVRENVPSGLVLVHGDRGTVYPVFACASTRPEAKETRVGARMQAGLR